MCPKFRSTSDYPKYRIAFRTGLISIMKFWYSASLELFLTKIVQFFFDVNWFILKEYTSIIYPGSLNPKFK